MHSEYSPAEDSFPKVFWNARGAVWIILITGLVSFGSGSVLGLIPAILSDRYARLRYGYDEPAICHHHHHSTEDGETTRSPCDKGFRDAETTAATANFVSYGFSIVSNPVIGTYSDTIGRRPILLLSLLLSCIPATMLVALVLKTTMQPYWYYTSVTVLGIVPYPNIAFAALADSIPKHHRTASYGILMAAFFGGFSVAPSMAVVWTNPVVLSIISLVLIVSAFLTAFCILPETLSLIPGALPSQIPNVHHDSMSITTDLNMGVDDDDDDDEDDNTADSDEIDDTLANRADLSTWVLRCAQRALHAIKATAEKYYNRLSILASTTTLQLLTLASFLSAMVYSTDATLFVYYVENSFSVGPKDIAGLCLVLGIAGIVVQGGLLSFLLRLFGERNLLVLSFISGTFHNILYWSARSKGALYLAMVASQLTKTNFPLLSSLAGAQVSELEQGQLQGVLSAINALGMAIGPKIFLTVSSTTSQVFGYAALVYGLGVVVVAFVACDTSSEGSIRDDRSRVVDDEELNDCNEQEGEGLEEPLLSHEPDATPMIPD